MPGNLKRRPPHREPAELTWSEPEPGVPVRSQHHSPGIAALLSHFSDPVWLAEDEKRLEDTDVNQQGDPEQDKEDPECPLPRIGQVETPTDHMCDTCSDRENRQPDVGEVPCLTLYFHLPPPQGHDDQRDQRVRRQGRKTGAPGRRKRVEQCEPF